MNESSQEEDLEAIKGSQKDLQDDLKFLAQQNYKTVDMSTNHKDKVCCKITKKGIQSMPKENCRNIMHLIISWNNIENQGCKYLARLDMKRLTHLQIGANKIDSAGLAHLYKGQWKQLKELIFFDNHLSSQSISNLVRGHWNAISFINISWNNINQLGGTYFVMSEAPRLTKLLMNCNQIVGELKEFLIVKFSDIKQITI